jgi:cysteine-rich repeat protein
VSISDLRLDCPYSLCVDVGDPSMRYNDCSPSLACGSAQSDMGAFGGRGSCAWVEDRCGNGTLDAGEECDDGNKNDGDCCSSSCKFEALGSACDDGNVCTSNDQCDGAGTCAGTANTAACDDGLLCNGVDTCSGGLCNVHSEDLCPTVAGCATMVTGQIDTETWTAAGSPYCVTGDVLVKGSGLVIQPGVRVEFQGDYAFEVDSTLKAVGTEAAPIVFTKGAALAGTVGKGVFFNNAAPGSVLDHCRFEYLNDGGLHIVNSFPTIESCSITNNNVTGNGGGIRVSLGSPGELVIKNSHIDSNSATGHGGGVYAELSTGALTLEDCTVNNNQANSTFAYAS